MKWNSLESQAEPPPQTFFELPSFMNIRNPTNGMDGTLRVTWWNHGLSGAFSGLTRIDGRMNLDIMLIWNLNWPQCFSGCRPIIHQNKGHLGSTMFPSILRWEQHVSYAVLTMASISWFFSVSCPRRLASSSVTASNLSRRLLFSFRRLTMTLAIAQGQDLASCLLKTYWNSKLFLWVFVPCLFPPWESCDFPPSSWSPSPITQQILGVFVERSP